MHRGMVWWWYLLPTEDTRTCCGITYTVLCSVGMDTTCCGWIHRMMLRHPVVWYPLLLMVCYALLLRCTVHCASTADGMV